MIQGRASPPMSFTKDGSDVGTLFGVGDFCCRGFNILQVRRASGSNSITPVYVSFEKIKATRLSNL